MLQSQFMRELYIKAQRFEKKLELLSDSDAKKDLLLKLQAFQTDIHAVNLEQIQNFIHDSSSSLKNALECNTKQLAQLLNKDISPNDLRIILENQQKISDLSSLLEHMQKIGLRLDDQQVDLSCGSGRAKSEADHCLKEDEKLRYDPLEDNKLLIWDVNQSVYKKSLELQTLESSGINLSDISSILQYLGIRTDDYVNSNQLSDGMQDLVELSGEL